jgi:ribosomal protein S18 acetylase RimI-like enzyme
VSALSPGDVGHRVVVRHRLTDSLLTDVVGVLESWGPEALVVRRADASTEVVRHHDVTAAKTVPPTPLRRVDLDAVLLATALGRPAVETERLGEWFLRASGGWTGRANSVLPYGDPGVPAADALRRAAEFYTARDLPPLALVPLGSPADELFRGQGWVEARPEQSDTLVLHTTLDLVNAEPGVRVELSEQPDDEWFAVAFEGGPVPAAAPVVMTGAPVAAFASIRLDGRTVAVARAALTGHWVGIDGVNVLTGYRRQRLGTALLRALARWAGSRGGRRTYLEVVEENAAALTAYTALGYREAYRYRYLTTP